LIVAITGNTDAASIEKSWDSEMDEIVFKPVTFQVLSTILQEVLNVQ
jgi:hypothetical protein